LRWVDVQNVAYAVKRGLLKFLEFSVVVEGVLLELDE
jgi:hypothetical protein